MKRIDAHQHFWKFDPLRHEWITNEMNVIKKDFLPHELQPLLLQFNFDGCVAVQVDQSERETQFLIDLAKENDFIKGIVGWVNLQGDDIEERLEYHKSFKIIKGFRHILQGERDRKFMLNPKFMRGISMLQKNNFTYDILIYTDQLKYVQSFVNAFPKQKFVIDHLAKPGIKLKSLDEWKKEIYKVAECENVYCKVSGMVTEADLDKWEIDDFTPYLDTVTGAFGTERLMFGSDWPVCLLAASYSEVVNIPAKYFSSFSKSEQEKIFGGNAVEFYDLNQVYN
jgi:L-fuconolactonase